MSKHKLVVILFVTILLVIVSSFTFSSSVFAATCTGSGCNGLNPHTTGCDASATTVRVIYPASSRVELRKSLISQCSTYWARTRNTDDVLKRSFYANATLWYPVGGYLYYYTTSSPAPIAYLQVVYTLQRYYSAFPPGLKACGYVGPGYISGPVGSPCTSP